MNVKRSLALFLAFAFLVCSVPSAAAESHGKISLGLNKGGTGRYENVTVSVVPVVLNGELLESDVPAFSWGGRTMAPVRLIAERLGATVQWEEGTTEVVITVNAITIQLKMGSAQAKVNGKTVTLYDGIPAMVAKYNGIERTMVPLRFVAEQLGGRAEWLQETCTAAIYTGQAGSGTGNGVHTQKTVVLDAGHGGSQTGAVYEGICEKDLNLAVTKKVETLLRSDGYQVIMTRTGDIDVDLYTRAAIANTADADVFVSLHSNAAVNAPSFTGIYTYYYPTSRRGAQLAQSIQAPLCAITGAIDRGTESADFVVLRETNMCAVLVEMGFMSNSGELQKLTTPAYQDKLAAGIAQGIAAYLKGI